MLSRSPRIAAVAQTHDTRRKSAAPSRAAHLLTYIFGVPYTFFVLGISMMLSLFARADVRALRELGKISWDGNPDEIYLKADESVTDKDSDYAYIVLKYTDTNNVGTLTFANGVMAGANILLVGGGGAGGSGGDTGNRRGAGGGGGAGGYVYNESVAFDSGTYSITVGAGGAAAAAGSKMPGGNGTSSLICTNDVIIYEAYGGGGGGAECDGKGGAELGSGGGGSREYNSGNIDHVGGICTTGQGNNGGAGKQGQTAGGGGGAGKAGDDGVSANVGGNGGSGVTNFITGVATVYAGGGGGGTKAANASSIGAGGIGGGGSGAGNGIDAVSGIANTGGGGGGGSLTVAGANGGSGVVIVRIVEALEVEIENMTVPPQTFTGENIAPVDFGISYEFVEGPAGESTTNETNVGEYYFWVQPVTARGFKWKDNGGTEARKVTWNIVKRLIDKPGTVSGLVYTGENQVGVTNSADCAKFCTFSAKSVTNATNAGTYTYSVSLNEPENTAWSDGSTADVDGSWTIAQVKVARPILNPEVLEFDNTDKQGFIFIDYERYKLTAGETNATVGGTHEFTFELLGNDEAENYVWEDTDPASAEPYSGVWTIKAAANAITELSLTGWRIGGEAKSPTISAKWGVVPDNTAVYYYGLGDNAESVTSWTTNINDITTADMWVLRAVIPETPSWRAATNTTTFLMWDDPGMLLHNWTEIMIKGTTSVLSNFAVPIRVSKERMPGFSYGEAEPSQLVFIDELGNLLSYDVDTWNTTGESVIWVKLVTLPTEGITVTMYWNLREGKIAPGNTSTNVWSDYIGVWHLSETSAGMASVKDASGHQDGKGHSSSLVADGIFGKARGRHETPNTTGYAHGPAVAVPEYTDLDEFSNGAFTISGWVMLRSTTTGWAYLFARKNGDTTTGWAAQFRGSTGSSGKDDGISFWRAGGSGQYYTFNTANKFSANTWAKYDFVRDGNTLAFYLNGSLVETKTGIGTIEGGNQPFTIGGMNIESTDPSGKASTLNGYSDEVRIMPAALDPAYIAADYKYGSDSTMSTNGIVYCDGLKVDYWVVEPAMDKTQWDVNDTEKGQITNYGQLRYGEVTNYIYSVYDKSETYNTPAEITNAGNYLAVFTQVDTNGYKRIEKVFEIYVTESKPYSDIVGNGGDSGRVLLMNNHIGDDSGAPDIDYQGWYDADNAGAKSSSTPTFWHHENLATPGAQGVNLMNGTASTLYTKDYGHRLWHLDNCRHGNTFPTSNNAGLETAQNYLAWSTFSRRINEHNPNRAAQRKTVGQVVMQNTEGAAVYSPCYTNGIGTIYFDAVNGWCRDGENYDKYKIVVEIATNTVAGRAPTDANCKVVETNEIDSVVTTNWYGNLRDGQEWIAMPMIPYLRDTNDGTGKFGALDETDELALAVTHGATTGNFYRVVVKLDFAGPVRFRIKRTTCVPHSGDGAFAVDEGGFILLDNIIASIPAMGATLVSSGHYDDEKTGSQTLGWELATSVPYPSVGDTANIVPYAKPEFTLNAGDGSTPDTSTFFSSATMHYRWRYLKQTLHQPISNWKNIALNPSDNFKAIGPLDLPSRPGDVEYWFEYRLQAPYYEYVDYSGIGKQIDYTEERGVLTNALNSATALASAGTNWFFRIREGKSDYSGLDVVYRRGTSETSERVHMALAGDHVWRGFVQTKEDQTGEITYRIEALDEHTEPFAEYAATTNYLRCRVENPSFPVSDSLEQGTSDSWSTLTLDAATGYVMFQIDDTDKDAMSLTIVHADYQNVNGWSDARNRVGHDKSGGTVNQIFVGTSTTNAYKVGTSPTKKTFSDDFSEWGNMAVTNESWTFPVGLSDIQSNHLHGRKAYETFASGSDTNGIWEVGQGMWVAKKYLNNADGEGVALQMEGNGKGYLQFTDKDTAPRGIESISFNARLGQFVQFNDFAYYYGENISKMQNYTFVTRAAFDTKSNAFSGNGSLSLVANYLPNKGCYEARWEWIGDKLKPNPSNNRGQRLCLYKWVVNNDGTKTSTLKVAWTNTIAIPNPVSSFAATGQNFEPFFISVSNDTASASTMVMTGVRLKAKGGSGTDKANNTVGITLSAHPWDDTTGEVNDKGNWHVICFRDTDKRLTKGTYGVLSANCDGVFGKPQISSGVCPFPSEPGAGKTIAKSGMSVAIGKLTLEPCAEDFKQPTDPDEESNWNIPVGRMAATNDASVTHLNGIISKPTAQEFQIFFGTAGRANWPDKPNISTNIVGFGGSPIVIPLFKTEDCSVRFAVAGTIESVRTDVVIDSLVMRQWRGGNWNGTDVLAEGIAPSWIPMDAEKQKEKFSPVFTNFIFTSCWTTNNNILMSAKRSNLDMPCAIRSPLMDYMANNGSDGDGSYRGIGLGTVSIGYKDAQQNASLLLQIATNAVEWSMVDTFDKSFSENYWVTRTNYNFATMSAELRKKGVLNFYLGLHSVTGMVRIIVNPEVINSISNVTDRARFGEVTITSISCSDEPSVDVHSWWGWNMRTVGGDTDDAENMMLLDDFSMKPGRAGLSLALNNSVDAENCQVSKIDYNERLSYVKHKPFVQTPTFASNIVGEVSFKARKYAATDGIATVALFGSTDATETDEGTWESIKGAVFSVSNDWYETYSYKTDPGQNFKAFRLAVIGVDGVSDATGGGPGTLPDGRRAERVLLDELFVSEAVRARMGFRNVGCFKSDMPGLGEVPNVPSRLEQPLCGEAWGVQCEIYGAQLASDIDFDHTPRVRLHWFDKGSGVVVGGCSPWGYDKWKDLGSYHKSAWLVKADGVEDGRYVYRSSLMKSPESVISMSTTAPTYVQYTLEVVFYTKGSSVPVTNFLSRTEWGVDGKGPEWYRPLDLNAEYGGSTDSFAAYNILDNVAPGWAWFNEVNVFGIFNEYLENTDANCQYVEIAQPPEADISGWSVRILEAQTSNGLVETNTLATFGVPGLEGTKDAKWIDPQANMVFRVIANRQAQTTGQLKRADGTLDGVWELENTYLTNMSGDSNGDTTITPTKPFGLQLVRKSGIIEHEIVAMGTNWWKDLSIIYQRQYHPTNAVNFLNANISGAQFFYVGMDDDAGETKSLGVFQNNGMTNDWNNTMKKSPGRKNPDQYIDPDHPVPSGESVLVYFTVSGDNILQWDGETFTNGLIMTTVTKGSQRGTNVVYEVSPWYEVGTVTTNGVSAAGNLVQTTPGNAQPRRYRLEGVGKGASNNVVVVATAAPDSRLATLYDVDEDNPYRPAIIDWLGNGTDLYGNPFYDKNSGEIKLAEFRTMNNTFVTNMTLTEMYWLDMDPTIGKLALIGGMAEAPTSREVTLPGGATRKYLKMGVYMMITNENDVVTVPDYQRGPNDKYTHWTPYALRGLVPGSNSLGFEQSRDSWNSVTFKLTGLLLTGNTNPKNPDNWMPLRWFVFREDSFTPEGLSRIEIEDPHSPDSIGYNTGWGQWWESHPDVTIDPVYFWSIDTRWQPIGAEPLKQENFYGN